MMKIIHEQLKIAYAKLKQKHKDKIVAVLLLLFAIVIFLLGWIIASWPEGQWPK